LLVKTLTKDKKVGKSGSCISCISFTGCISCPDSYCDSCTGLALSGFIPLWEHPITS